ncbi:MAG TPA: class I SAM-dependent methyltransferase [Tepidisphaeraceae bacterium]|nr:class I SAM-dependent methyltransferase [Tepidisphaeraceae bacterium]
MANRFAEGHRVDRDRPHIFHRDYWTLRHLLDGARDFAARHADALRGKRVLDFGAGVSPYAALIAGAGAELLRADIDPQDATVLRIDPADGRVPLDDASVEAVLSTQVLEHVADVQGYLREAFRLLRPGGLLYLSTHGAFVLHRNPTDFRRWTIDGLAHELRQAGFEIDRIEPRIGIFAMSTHLRSITLGGATRRIPFTGWLRPIIYLLFNLRMGVEDRLTPASVMDAHPELLLATARKPAVATPRSATADATGAPTTPPAG